MWFVYICNKKGKLYTGITTNLANRLHQHGNPKLIHKEEHPNKFTAARREKEIKSWPRARKLALTSDPFLFLVST